MTAIIGYHVSHEQFPPSALLRLARRADRAGFRVALNSDHFHPWTEKQGESGFAWSFMGAALATTDFASLGVVNAPGQRYHPAIIAQALGTLGEMFPGRVWAALGSGQALNEHITGGGWPAKDVRNARLRECADVIRALLAGEQVTHRGLVTVEDARLYTRPARPPLLAAAALTPETAAWAAGWADALITAFGSRQQVERVVHAFREHGGEHKPMFLKVQLSWAPTDEQARAGAHEQWASNVLPSSVLGELRTPAQFDAFAGVVQPSDVARTVRTSSDLGRQRGWLEEDLALGFDHIYLHNVSRQQEAFIDAFAEHVLPQLGGQPGQ